MDRRTAGRIAERLDRGEVCAVATIVATRGSTPQGAGAAAVITATGEILGTIGGGCLEQEARLRALDVLRDGQPVLFEVDLTHGFEHDTGLICGGRAEILVERPRADQRSLYRVAERGHARDGTVAWAVRLAGRLAERAVAADDGDGAGEAALLAVAQEGLAARRAGLVETPEGRVRVDLERPRPRLWIVGAGHVGQAVARHAGPLGFDLVVVDERPDLCTEQRFPGASRRLVGDLGTVLAAEPLGPDDAVVIVTPTPRHDAAALAAVLDRGAGYVGLIGSRRKIRLLREQLVEAGSLPATAFDPLHAPIGLDIGAETVDEIAISIVAELVAVRRGRG